jgi:hypothetical protein
MASPECSQFSLCPSLVSVKALFELRDLFASLPLPADCDRASLQQPMIEKLRAMRLHGMADGTVVPLGGQQNSSTVRRLAGAAL